jgi:hypothetical protein
MYRRADEEKMYGRIFRCARPIPYVPPVTGGRIWWFVFNIVEGTCEARSFSKAVSLNAPCYKSVTIAGLSIQIAAEE